MTPQVDVRGLHAQLCPNAPRTQCHLCGSGETRVSYRRCRNRRQGIAGFYDLLRCSECGCGFLDPLPSQEVLGQLYGLEYHSHVPDAPTLGKLGRMVRDMLVWPYRMRYGSEAWDLPPFGRGRLLDIGCGTGHFLQVAHSKGWRCYGLDISPSGLETACRRGCSEDLFCGGLESIPFRHDAFEMITLWHTLEHMPDPAGTLARLRDLLTPAGRLVMAVPNLDSIEARFLGRRWIEIDVPGHLFFFTPRSLRRLIENTGLRWVRMRPQLHPSSVADAVDFLIDDLTGAVRCSQRLYLYRLLFPLVALSNVFGNQGCIEVMVEKA